MPRRRPSTKAISARLSEALLAELYALLDGTGITITHIFETSVRDYLAGPRAAAIRTLKETNR